MDARSQAVTPPVVCCLYLEDSNGKFAFLHVLFLFYMKQTWEYQDRWVHYTQFIEREDRIHSYHYIYCVRWSIPTAKRPMPPVTASAFFTIKITKNKPPVSSSFSPPFT